MRLKNYEWTAFIWGDECSNIGNFNFSWALAPAQGCFFNILPTDCYIITTYSQPLTINTTYQSTKLPAKLKYLRTGCKFPP